jgi:hypothetical protein
MTSLVLLLSLLLQAPAAPAATANTGGVIRGRVTAGDTGKPLKRASVRLQSAADGPAVRMTANTNALGIFELSDVPPGQYLVVVSRAGYLARQYGQQRANERGVAVDVGAGASVDRIDVALPRGSVLAGRLTDERGEPYQGAQMVALAPRYVSGKRSFAPVGTATSDDLGQYRIPGLPPGSYLIVALSTETWRSETARLGFAETFYPGVAQDAAQAIALAPAQQRLDLDFSLRPAPVVRVTGRVQSESGPMAAPAVNMAYQFGTASVAFGSRNIRADADGAFEITDVAEGVYSLSWRGGGAALPLAVHDTDIEGLVLPTRAGSTVSGIVTTDDGTPPPFSPSGVRINTLTPFDDALPMLRVVSPEADWTFKFTNAGGRFLFRPLSLPPGWALGAVKIGDADVTDVPWNVPTGGKTIEGLRVILTQKIGRITGSIVEADGKPATDAVAIVFAEDDTLWIPGSRFVRTERPGKDGQFTLTGMPPGTYRAVALPTIEDGQWEDSAFLAQLRDGAERFVLDEGASRALTLKLPVRK